MVCFQRSCNLIEKVFRIIKRVVRNWRFKIQLNIFSAFLWQDILDCVCPIWVTITDMVWEESWLRCSSIVSRKCLGVKQLKQTDFLLLFPLVDFWRRLTHSLPLQHPSSLKLCRLVATRRHRLLSPCSGETRASTIFRTPSVHVVVKPMQIHS